MIARHARAFLAALCVAGCAAAPAPETPALRVIDLQNPGFELDPLQDSHCAPKWACSAHSDPGSFVYNVDASQAAAGARSLRIDRVRNEPWGIIAQSIRDPALRGAKVRFSLAVRTQGAEGKGAGPFLQFHDGSGRVIGDVKKLAKGTSAWQRLSVEFVVPPATHLLEAGALLEGPGSAWIDEARLELLELAAPVKNPV